MEVMVRVAIKGDPFTVNKATFSFFVNTKAARCMVFGPGLLRGKAGHRQKMIMQAKDSTGKARSSGDDQIKVGERWKMEGRGWARWVGEECAGEVSMEG